MFYRRMWPLLQNELPYSFSNSNTVGFIFFTIVNNTFIFLAGLVYVGCRPRDFLKHAICLVA